MKLISNIGADRVVDLLKRSLKSNGNLDAITPSFSLFAFHELSSALEQLAGARLILPALEGDLGLLGGPGDRLARNQLQMRWLARECSEWTSNKVSVRAAVGSVPQGALIAKSPAGEPVAAIQGSTALTTDGLGLAT